MIAKQAGKNQNRFPEEDWKELEALEMVEAYQRVPSNRALPKP